MEVIAIILIVSYCLLIWVFTVSWKRIESKPNLYNGLNKRLISVILPVRNESLNISNLLMDLASQKLTNGDFEVIVVDDDSQDDTPQLVEQFIYGKPNFSLVKLKNGTPHFTPKKRALNAGIGASRGEIIVTTDGDCSVKPNWLQSISSQFVNGTQFVSGPVAFKEEQKPFEKLQMMEFASLIGVGASSMELGYPNICNGANLAFKKSAFQKLQGYNGNGHLASGDDEFLLQKFSSKFKDGIRFLKNDEAVVTTNAKPNLKEFYHQRKRWTSKLKHHKQWHIKLLPLWIFVVNFALLSTVVLSVMGYFNWGVCLGLLCIKFITEAYYLNAILNFFKRKIHWPEFLMLQFIHPFYIVLFGLFTNFGTFNWKGRTYHE